MIRRGSWVPETFAISLIILLPIWLFYPALFGGQRLWGQDEIAVNIPLKAAAQRALAEGEPPLWLPDILGGLPNIAASNLQFLYPTELLSSLPGADIQASFAWDSAFHVAWGGLGMLAFLRALGLGLPAALMGALTFLLSGSLVSGVYGGYRNFVKATAWLPWVFWAAEVAWARRSWLHWACAGGALGMMLLSVSAQLAAYTAPAVAGWSVLRVLGSRGPSWTAKLGRLAAGALLALLTAALISSPQMLPTWEHLPWSLRGSASYEFFSTGSFGVAEAITWAVPGYLGWASPTYFGRQEYAFMTPYLGLAPWVLAAAGVTALRRDPVAVGWMAFLLIAGFVVAIGPATPVHRLLYGLPIFGGFRISARALMLCTLAVSALAAYGWERIVVRSRTAFWAAGAAWAALLMAAFIAWDTGPMTAERGAHSLKILSGLGGMEEVLRRMVLASALRTASLLWVLLPLVALLAWRRGGPWALAALVAFHVFDQAWALGHFIQFQPPGSRAPEIAAVKEALPALGDGPWRFEPRVVRPAITTPAERERHGLWTGILPNEAVLVGRESIDGQHSMGLEGTQRIRAALGDGAFRDLMGVAHVVTVVEAPGLRRVVVEANPGAMPRARLLDKVVTVPDREAAFRAMARTGFDPRSQVVIEQDFPQAPQPLKGEVRWLSKTTNTMELAVEANKPAVLLVASAWHPAWRASLDGRPARVLRANGGLKAVLVGPGRHRVKLWHSARLLWMGVAAFFLGLGLIAGLAWAGPRAS